MVLNPSSFKQSAESAVAPATRGEHVVTVLSGLWMTVGLFLDGFFHQNLTSAEESFITPWHGVFYAGFAASAVWLVTLARRRSGGARDWRLRHLPPGYSGARRGLVLFAAGGVGDSLWHTRYGVERGIDALLSPTHLVLFAGLVLILTTPLRALREDAESPPGPWLVVASLTSATALAGFFLNFAWGLGISALARVPYNAATDAGETALIAAVASMLVATAVLFGAARVLGVLVPPPPGAFTVLFGTVALLVSAAFDEDAEGIAAALLAGILLDAGRRLTGRHGDARVAGTSAGVMWLAYFRLLQVFSDLQWSPEVWIGATVLCVFAAAAVTVPLVAVPVKEEVPRPAREAAYR